MPENSVRPVRSAEGAALDARVGFADSAPLLLVNEASAADLNARLARRGARPVPVYRFRPNLVVAGQVPYEEDRWSRLRIGRAVFRVIKRCSRCPVTTIDPARCELAIEPLATLGDYRKSNGKVYFGIKLLREDSAAGPASLTVGDAVEVLEEGGSPNPEEREGGPGGDPAERSRHTSKAEEIMLFTYSYWTFFDEILDVDRRRPGSGGGPLGPRGMAH